MSSATEIERSQAVLDVTAHYRRRERALSALVVVLVVSLFLGTYLATSLLPAIGVGALSLVSTRAPLFKSSGTARLRTDRHPETVVAEFSSATPPTLALQWGVADAITTEAGVTTYAISSLFGLHSVEMVVDTHTNATPDGAQLIESVVTVDDRPWGTYTSTISRENGQTIIEVDYTSNRRFDLRYLPQVLLASRYRDDVLAVQGYTVVARDTRISV
ncbi:hypothetical protein [Halovivax limisalsi]|uniref:hypothetical protein n=1 Tax=Halovivax limisalsi TaxID=1453760 RepID=UPI001FFCCD9F|nr:hypothetical protein [Halovivax limisalsi]